MEESSILLAFTQVSVAFVGFASIVATFRFKDEFSINKNDANDLQLIVNSGLMGTFFSILPFVFWSFGFKDSSVWALCSGIMSINYLCFIYYLSRKVRISKFRRNKSKILVSIYFIIGILILILNCLNAFNIVFLREFGPFFLSLIYPLCMVGYMFTRLLFLPIWRNLKKQQS
ncbi:hypothetical protein ACFO5O_05430 [Geojedonia litorea]|uniref:Polysaccharide biosynthesis protein C-terminal domain-containing protein n=1 Tax=Geojedonia litorea TaxID=1268269 RepID=A0ABV9N2U8_9FLAO